MIHSLISPSAASRVLRCPASLLASLHMPDPGSEAALSGTRLHEDAEAQIAAGEPIDGSPVAGYVSTVLDVIASPSTLCYGVEAKVPLNIAGIGGQFGTCDFWAVRSIGCGIGVTIIDLKTGSIKVDPANNAQLRLYAHGVLNQLSPEYDDAEIIEVCYGIHQGGELSLFVETYAEHVVEIAAIDQSYQKALSLSPPFADAVGTHCTYCRYKAACPTQQRSLRDALGLVTVESATDADSADLVSVWRLAQFAEDVRDAAQAQLQRRLEFTGELADGLKLAKYQPPRRWADEAAVRQMLVDLKCFELLKPVGVAAVAKVLEIPDGLVESKPSEVRVRLA